MLMAFTSTMSVGLWPAARFSPLHALWRSQILQHENISLEGKDVVVGGASNIVGKPMALMLMQHQATICICHAKSRDLAQFTLLADVLWRPRDIPI
jgi:methylenetetrahydrofolate dehydrogenase (NADP+)/methenyltetrahydrofolate cyclohydrolase